MEFGFVSSFVFFLAPDVGPDEAFTFADMIVVLDVYVDVDEVDEKYVSCLLLIMSRWKSNDLDEGLVREVIEG